MSDVSQNLGALDYTLATLETHRIDYSRITIVQGVRPIGSGGFGTVMLALLQDTDVAGGSQRVAVKMLRCITSSEEDRHQTAFRLAREVKVWVGLHHPNVLPLIGFNLPWDLSTAWIICPYEPNGNAVEYLARIMPDMAKRLELVLDTANGLAYLHGRDPPVIHGDLKGTNILIGQDTRAKLCDFGLARVLNSAPSGLTSTRRVKGTFRYLSPELTLEEELSLTLESDMWAWGCLAAEVLTDRIPFHTIKADAAVILMIARGVKPVSLEGIPVPPPVRDVLHKCWETEPVARPDIQECASVVDLATSVTLDLLSRPKPNEVPPSFKKSGHGWVALFSSEEPRRKLDVDLVSEHSVENYSVLGALKISPDGSSLAAGFWRQTILYNVWTGAQICGFLHDFHSCTISFSPDGKLLAVSGTYDLRPAAVKIWHIDARTCLHTFPVPQRISPHLSGQTLVSFSPHNTFIVYSFKTDIRIYDQVGNTHFIIDTLSPNGVLKIDSLVVSPDSRHIACGYPDGSVRIADVLSGTLLATLVEATRVPVVHLVYAPNGKGLASCSSYGPIQFWALGGLNSNADATADVQLSSPEQTLEAPWGERIRSLAYSPDGLWIVGELRPSGRIMLWDAITRRAEMVLHHESGRFFDPPMAVSSVASESGWMVASARREMFSSRTQMWKFKSVC